MAGAEPRVPRLPGVGETALDRPTYPYYTGLDEQNDRFRSFIPFTVTLIHFTIQPISSRWIYVYISMSHSMSHQYDCRGDRSGNPE